MKTKSTIRRTGPAYIALFLYALTGNALLFARDRSSPGGASHSTVARSLLEISSRHPRVRKSAGMLAARISRAKYAAYFYPDPKFGVVYSNLPSGQFVYNRTPMTGIEFQLRQPIPFPGRLTLKARIADDAAEIARLGLAREKNDLARAYLETGIAAARLIKLKTLTEVYGRQIRIVSQTARTRYGVGRGNLADLSRANLMHSKYLQRAERFAGLLEGARKRLGYFYDYSTEPEADSDPQATERAPAPDEEFTGDPNVPPPEELRTYFRALERALDREQGRLGLRSLDIARAKIAVQSSDRRASLARLDYAPDFEAFAAYRQRSPVANDPVSGEDFASFGLSMRLPLWSAFTNHHQVRAERKEHEANVNDQKDVKGRVFALAGDLAARKSSLEERIKMYRTRLVPQARRARSSAQLAYGTGGVDFDTLLNSWDTLYMQKAELIELEAGRDRLTVALAALYNLVLPEYEKQAEETKTAREEES